jgi:hypothetical protein
MDDVPTDERTDVLGRRVRWLDRYRRRVAIGISIVMTPILELALKSWLGRDWPNVHAWMLAITIGISSWWLIEVGLAWQTAVWETEYDTRLRDHGLPRAEIVVRK